VCPHRPPTQLGDHPVQQGAVAAEGVRRLYARAQVGGFLLDVPSTLSSEEEN